MIQLHHLKNSRSQRVIWLLEELELPYEIIYHQRAGKTAPIASLLAVHPLGKAPVLCDGDITLAETGAILEYLNEVYGNQKLEPAKGTPERSQYLYWKQFAEGSLMPYLAMKLVFAAIVSGTPFIVRPLVKFIFSLVNAQYLNPNIQRELDFIEKTLHKNTWLAGEAFSIADVFMGFMLEAVAGRMAKATSHPNINQYVTRIRARPAYQRAVERGDWSAVEHAQYWAFLAKP